jgi:hypothetical protein
MVGKKRGFFAETELKLYSSIYIYKKARPGLIVLLVATIAKHEETLILENGNILTLPLPYISLIHLLLLQLHCVKGPPHLFYNYQRAL